MSERELIPAGYYDAVAACIKNEAGDDAYVQFGSTKGGDPQICVNFEIVSGPHAGHRVAWYGYFTEKTAKRTVESLRYCGFKGDDLMGALAQKLDNQVSIKIEHNEYQGKVSERVAWVNQPGGPGVRLQAPMNTADLRSFSARMKASVAGVPEATDGRKAPPAGQVSPSTDLADDLSF